MLVEPKTRLVGRAYGQGGDPGGIDSVMVEHRLQPALSCCTSPQFALAIIQESRLFSACRLLQEPIMGYPSSKDVLEIAESLYSAVKSVVILNVKLVVNLVPTPQFRNVARIAA
ncbi:hypothetical protein M758_12G004100 [Ceratodon purpureus]|uniref:Uncharacterized protein n=1 Tax=Ceratodon purpureus TaxID=3225 RepID=A0A8T0G2E2_CERPU|nr:hypothetical protein KC19_12G001300 [Ceratodon purpureus]KAG0597557.1 hypothetical protein M758_12G004100 [Ceratodon purpureus]